MPAEVAHFKSDPVGRMRTLAKEPGRENVEVVSAHVVAMPAATQRADVVWLHLSDHDLYTALIQAKGATAADCGDGGCDNGTCESGMCQSVPTHP